MNAHSIRLALAVIALLSGLTRIHADDIFVDEFNDNSGGLPGGWIRFSGSDIRPETSVIEGTANVSITDYRGGAIGGGAPTMIASPTFEVFPLGSATTELNVSIAGTSFSGGATPEAIFAFGGASYSLRFTLSLVSPSLNISLVNNTGEPTSTQIESFDLIDYTGGPVAFTITFQASSFRVTSTQNNLNSGNLSYAEYDIAGFNDVTALGPLAQIVLISEATGQEGTATTNFDRVAYTTDATYTPPVTVVPPANSAQKASLIAQIKKLEKQLKSAKRARNASKQKKLVLKIKKLKKQLAAL